jgi:hypothetical protein
MMKKYLKNYKVMAKDKMRELKENQLKKIWRDKGVKEDLSLTEAQMNNLAKEMADTEEKFNKLIKHGH